MTTNRFLIFLGLKAQEIGGFANDIKLAFVALVGLVLWAVFGV